MMASIQRFVISVLLILSITFVFFAQASEASKGPKVTHKVCQFLSCLDIGAFMSISRASSSLEGVAGYRMSELFFVLL
jgi:hypothetical protein